MDFKDVTKNLTSLTDDRIKNRMDELFRVNPRFSNLDSANRELIFGLIKKYKEKIRSGVKPSAYTIHKDTYNLYENRLKLHLTSTDLDQIRNLLGSFKG
ncbi:MAG: hypothetical protein ACYC40_03235 [Patescibacteria group bacterium]